MDYPPVRIPAMRLKSVGWAAFALTGLGLGGTPARAAHCGACGYPAAAVAPEQCLPPVARYRVRYQPVMEQQTRTAYRTCYRTEWREESYTVMRQVYEQHVAQETVP